MEKRVLGKTGLTISRLGLGGIPVQRIAPEQTAELVKYLMEQGVNFIDTARGYTVSEVYLGQALEGIRDQFILATKSFSRTKEGILKDVDISLHNLRTDYIDLYQLHNPSAPELEQILAPGGALEGLREAVAAGKIGHIGITLHSLELFERVLEFDWVETVMFPYNIVETQGQKLIEACSRRQIGFIAMKPMAGGVIEDATTAVRYLVNDPNVSVVIPGMATIAEAQENIAAASDTSPLNAEELASVAHIRSTVDNSICRRCNYCAPCTVGINIPSIFLMEGYYNRYDLRDWAVERYNGFAVKASACVECGVCESRCPYELPIRKMMKKAAEIFEK